MLVEQFVPWDVYSKFAKQIKKHSVSEAIQTGSTYVSTLEKGVVSEENR